MCQKYMQDLELSHIAEENRECGGEHRIQVRTQNDTTTLENSFFCN